MENLRYFFTTVLGLVVLFQISQTHAGTDVPVLIWGADLPASKNNLVNPFEKTSQEDFEKIVTKIVGGSLDPLVVFVRDDLCIEDLTKHKDSLGPLMDVDSLIYRPRVDTPVTVLENLPFYNCTTEEQFETISEAQLVLREIVDLNTVPKSLSTMKDSRPNLVAALTGRSCRYSRSERIKRAADAATSDEPYFYVNTTRFLMYASVVPQVNISGTDSATLTKNPTEEGDGTVQSPLQLVFEYLVKNGTTSYNINILLRFPVKTPGYYSPEVLYKRDDENVTLRTMTDLSFPYNFSYHCSHNISFGNLSFVRFDLTDFQVQVDTNVFGDAYDCVGFMSIPIWAGIFVTSILALIMIWGLTMLLDIRTMDRFDDPKGKTITISVAAE